MLNGRKHIDQPDACKPGPLLNHGAKSWVVFVLRKLYVASLPVLSSVSVKMDAQIAVRAHLVQQVESAVVKINCAPVSVRALMWIGPIGHFLTVQFCQLFEAGLPVLLGQSIDEQLFVATRGPEVSRAGVRGSVNVRGFHAFALRSLH